MPGFQRVWGLRKPGDAIPDKDLLKYKEFLTISNKWQKKMAEVGIDLLVISRRLTREAGFRGLHSVARLYVHP